MILNRIEDENLFKPYIIEKRYRVEPISPVMPLTDNRKKQKSWDGDTFEVSPSQTAFADILMKQMNH